MAQSDMNRRIELALTLMNGLKALFGESQEAVDGLRSKSGGHLKQVFEREKVSVEDELAEYRANSENIYKIEMDITRRINEWHDFSKSGNAMGSLFYPLKYKMGISSLKKHIIKTNKELESYTIRNRFILQELREWEKDLERKAMDEMRSSEGFLCCIGIQARIEEIIADLKYLLPSIPGICPAILEPSGIGALQAKLLKTSVN